MVPGASARRATRQDIPQLVELMREFYAEASFPLDDAWASRAFANVLDEHSYGAVWVIERDATPVGHVVLSVRYAMEFGGLIAYIDDLYVRPPHRRTGAATAGLNALFVECRSRGCRSIQVEVGEHNEAAIALYRRYGMALGDDQRQTMKVTLAVDT